ncbi:MAG: BamA/TamA family outer membrane protein [bacterium]
MLLFLLVISAVEDARAIDELVVSLSVEGKGFSRFVSPGFRIGDRVNSETLGKGKEKIRQWLFDQGFWPNKVTVEIIPDDGGVKIKYLIDTVIKARLGGWIFEGDNPKVQRKVLSLLPSKGKILSSKLINRTEAITVAVYREAGFPLVWAFFTGIKETCGYLFPVIQVDTGPRVIINFITFNCRNRISEPLLTRYTGFKKDVLYSSRLVDRWRRRLERSGWVDVDSEDIVMRTDGSYGFRYWVSVSRSGEFLGAAGYISEERRLTGWMRLRLFNLMGTGRKIDTEWRSIGGFSHYSLSYTEPWFFRLPIELSGTIEHNTFDTSYSFTSLSIAGLLKAGDAGFVTSGGFDRMSGRDNGQTRWLGSGVTFDCRDRVVNPQRGFLFRVFSRVGKRDNGSKKGVLTKIELDFEPFIPLVGNYVMVNRFVARLVFAPYLMSIPELYRMGGVLSVRGYRDGVFLTPRAGWWNCELRYNFSQGSRGQIFFDSGIFQNQLGDYQAITGYGVGGRWRTKIGVLGIDYGIAWARSIWEGKLHLSFETGF